MSSVDPKIIQGIRVRKQAQELIKKADELQALRNRLVEISGIKERGMDPQEMTVSDEYLATLLIAAEDALKKEQLFSDTSDQTDQKQLRTKRLEI